MAVRRRARTPIRSWLIGPCGERQQPVAHRRFRLTRDSADLGFDSLMFVELATAIENAGGSISAPERFNEIQDVRELLTVVSRQAERSAEAGGARRR